MTLVYFFFASAAIILGYLGYAFASAYILNKPTWPFFKKVK